MHAAVLRASLIMLIITAPAYAQETYTAAQAQRGSALYATHCAACHGASLDGGAAAALSGSDFRRAYSKPKVTVDDLYYIIRTTMPKGAAASLEPHQYLDILAHILARNGVPAGATELKDNPAVLLAIRMNTDGEVKAAPSFIAGKRDRPTGRGPAMKDLLAAPLSPNDWLYHTRDYAGTRYSPLRQINTGNVRRLQISCIYQHGEQGNFQTGPIVHDGVMYITGVRFTVAIDAATCRQIWRYEWKKQDQEVWLNNRGVAIQDGYVVRATADGYLFALDAADGELLWARQVADPSLGETFTMAPLIYKDRILIGPAGSENAISGWVGAFRLEDGAPIWKFMTVPGATRAGGETWGNPKQIVLGGGATWTPFSLDPERGELYVAVTNPAPDLPAFLRPGDNLYTNSIVALDVNTGQLNWYRQLVPADDHDWDLTQVSPVFRGKVAGVDRNLVATVGKDGLLRLIDRDSHATLWESEVTTRENADAKVTSAGVRACPGVLGGVEWNGPALLASAGLLFTPAVDACSIFYADEDARYVEGRSYLGGRVVRDTLKAPAGWLTATNVADGSVKWKYKSARPMVGAVTTTAGGLVLAGEVTGDFIALDAARGNVLYRFYTGGPIGGGLISYAVKGKQYIAVASGRPSSFWWGAHPGGATIVVFALPGNQRE